MWQFVRTVDSRSVRRHRVAKLLGAAALLALISDLSLPAAFTGPVAAVANDKERSQDALARRQILAVLGASAMTPVAPALAAQVPFLGRPKGPFEVDPRDVVIVGDDKSEKSMAAKAVVVKLQKEAEAALETLQKDAQADLAGQGMINKFGIAELRDATNTINNLMDEISAAGTQRHQRLMIQAKYALEDDLPMPVSKKGAVQERGAKRLERIEDALRMYIKESSQLMSMLS